MPAQCAAVTTRSRWFDRLAACPTLVLCGRDEAPPPLAVHREMAAAIPGAVPQVIQSVGTCRRWRTPGR
jgi:pimeloyl-ACP methyl ester carboxylesterase